MVYFSKNIIYIRSKLLLHSWIARGWQCDTIFRQTARRISGTISGNILQSHSHVKRHAIPFVAVVIPHCDASCKQLIIQINIYTINIFTHSFDVKLTSDAQTLKKWHVNVSHCRYASTIYIWIDCIRCWYKIQYSDRIVWKYICVCLISHFYCAQWAWIIIHTTVSLYHRCWFLALLSIL